MNIKPIEPVEPSGFLFIPEHIMERDDLSLQEKCVYGRIIGLTKKEGYCYATNEWLGLKLNMSGKTISRHISSLTNKGFLYLEITKTKKKAGAPYEWGTRRKIYAFSVMGGHGYPKNEHPPYPKNEQYSITGISITALSKGGAHTNTNTEIPKSSEIQNNTDLKDGISLKEKTTESNESSLNPELSRTLELKKRKTAVKKLTKEVGRTPPAWMIEKEIGKLEESQAPLVSVSITQEYKEFCQSISKDRMAIHKPTYSGQILWNRIRKVYESYEVLCAARIAYRVDEWWKDNFTPELFFRDKNEKGEYVDHIGRFINYKVGEDESLRTIKLEMLQAKEANE